MAKDIDKAVDALNMAFPSHAEALVFQESLALLRIALTDIRRVADSMESLSITLAAIAQDAKQK